MIFCLLECTIVGYFVEEARRFTITVADVNPTLVTMVSVLLVSVQLAAFHQGKLIHHIVIRCGFVL